MTGVLDTTSSAEVTVGAGSTQFATTLQEGNVYQVVSTTAAWINLTAAAVARTSGNIYVPPNYPVLVKAPAGAANKVAIIQDAAGGFACLTLVGG